MTGLRLTLPDTEWLKNFCDPEVVSLEDYEQSVQESLSSFAKRRNHQVAMVQKYFTKQRELARELAR